ncbi:MAG: hypothetical protein JKY88_03680 [Pseudomonadales bacterium]|nr:hypothetical protein [Pseudomonadales bacterium]
MKKMFSISEVEGILVIEFEASPNYSQVLSCIDELAESEPSGYRLWDLSKIELDLSSEELRKVSLYRSKKKYKSSIKAAFLVTNDLSFGGMRQFGVYRAGDIGGEGRVFRSRIEAIEWLNE